MNRLKEASAFLLETARWSVENVFVPLAQGILMIVTALIICLATIVQLFKNVKNELNKF